MSFHSSDIDRGAVFFSVTPPLAATVVAPSSSPFGLRRQAALRRRDGVYRRLGKRAFESSLIVATAFVTVPLVLFMALLVWLDGGAPFYTQDRIGAGGRRFRILKLRTMVRDADAMLAQHLEGCPESRAEWVRTQKLKSDPRITRVGRVLRKTSLDELPQLLNVLNGTMSLVGPRPMMVDQQDAYNGTAYYRLRPGITGLWQISERNESEFTARVRYDDAYDRSVTLLGDVKIIAATVLVVLRGTGY